MIMVAGKGRTQDAITPSEKTETPKIASISHKYYHAINPLSLNIVRDKRQREAIDCVYTTLRLIAAQIPYLKFETGEKRLIRLSNPWSPGPHRRPVSFTLFEREWIDGMMVFVGN